MSSPFCARRIASSRHRSPGSACVSTTTTAGASPSWLLGNVATLVRMGFVRAQPRLSRFGER
jgi:hypothetical protein